MRNILLQTAALFLLFSALAFGQESPYFVTYDHHLEEPGNLDIEVSGTSNIPSSSQRFSIAPYMEFEYGVTANWTTELYLEGQGTWNDSTIFTGWRIENRFRPLKREHLINPVLYLEYENINEASKILKEIEGDAPDLTSSNAVLRGEADHELEGKLILSSNVKGWGISENMIAEKAVNDNESWQFGYALAAARPLALMGTGRPCIVCRQNFAAGAELFGGLGTRYNFGVKQTQQYFAPTVAFNTPHGTTFKFSPEFGLNDNSAGVLWRFGVSYEIQQFRDWFRRKQ